MNYRNYDFKYSYLYPFMGLVLYYLLTIMTILTLNRYFSIIRLNVFVLSTIFLFLLESIIRFKAGLKLDIPKFVFIFEAALFYLFLLFSTKGFYGFTVKDRGIWIVWSLNIYAWFQVIDITASFNVFRVDCEKIFEKSSGRWSFDEFRRLLDYPSTWKKVSRKITLINIPLLIIWAAFGKYSLLIVTGTILFLLIEIFLLALAYLDKKTIDWYIEGIERPLMLKEGWYRFLAIILITSLVFAAVLPYNYSPLPLKTIGHWLNSHLPQIKPEEIPINERPDGGSPIGETGRREEPAGIDFFEIIFFIFQLLLFLSLSLFVIIALIFLLRLEFKNIKNLPDFFKKFINFFISFIKGTFSRVKQINIKVRSSRYRIKKKRREKKDLIGETSRIKNINLPTDIRSLTIVIYNSMLRLLSIRGYGREKDYTPHEYSRMLGDKFINISIEIKKLTDFYVETIYSDHSFTKSTGSMIKNLWKKIKKVL